MPDATDHIEDPIAWCRERRDARDDMIRAIDYRSMDEAELALFVANDLGIKIRPGMSKADLVAGVDRLIGALRDA